MKKLLISKSISIAILLVINLNPIISQNIDHWEMVVSASDTWHYFPGNLEPPANWANNDFDASLWASGPGGIGYSDGDDGTTISSAPSVYLRINFNLIDTSTISVAILHVDYDDAFVAYLNGHEIARANIGILGLRPAFSSFAILDHEAKLYSGGIPENFIIHKDTLKKYTINGENTLALQVHNINATSSDLTSNAFLTLGIKDASTNYRPVPSWFNNPVSEKLNLPLLIIDTKGQEIIDDPKINVILKIVDNGPGKMNGFFDDATGFEGNIGIEIRGQSSQMFPKKSYAIETLNQTLQDTSVSLLGMPADEDWVLSAPFSDKSMLRNAITYHLGRKMGNWQPRFKYCEVYLNGSYNGVYMLIEKIKRDSLRVDINKLKPDEITGNNLTGGYIVKVDKTWDLLAEEFFTIHPSNRYRNARNYDFTFVYPKFDEIVPEQKAYLYNYLQELENVLNGSEFEDPENGFRKYLDINSFVDFQIMNELSNNVDGYRYSTFFYKKRDSDGGKLFAGPLWDFDLCYGNVDYSPLNLATDQWLFPHFGETEDFPMHWWNRLMEDAGYRKAFVDRWKELRAGSFKTDSILAYLNDTIQYLGAAINRNYDKWPILGQYVWPNYFIGSTYQQEIDYLKTWINNRLSWMDANVEIATILLDSKYIENQISVYPNPINRQMNLELEVKDLNKIDLEIIDLLGKRVLHSKYSPISKGKQAFQLNIPKVKPGYYILKVRQKEQIINVQKLVINN